ncbi:MAG: GntR family transcriptional regulator [Opitutus sp.]|nr:GntR family transcriptional regulator [Opitutus sp.]
MKQLGSDLAYDYIRKRILSGKIPPGSSLMTNDLATELRISRTPIRDALRQLETDGLVIIKPRLEASVKTMDPKEFKDMCGLRLALESHAASLAAQNRTTSDLQEIHDACESMRILVAQIAKMDENKSRIADLVLADVRFHVGIIAAAKNDLIKEEILRLHLINRVVSGPPPVLPEKRDRDKLASVLKSHEEIYAAIEARDADAAKTSMEKHIQGIIDNYVRTTEGADVNARRKLTEDELNYMT